MHELVFGEILIIFQGKYGVQKEKKMNFFPFHLWFEPLSCLKVENDKNIIIVFWFNSSNKFGFYGPESGFMCTSTEIK